MGKRVLALAGGVGGAKLLVGLAQVLPPEALTIVVNTGDDEMIHGLHVSPDLDTVMYSLAGLSNPETGWGLAGETFAVLQRLGELGGEAWFKLGDKDLATHIRRTELLSQGWTLSEVTAELCRRVGLQQVVAPMTDQPLRTRVKTDQGWMSFQEYFVKHGCAPLVESLAYHGADSAQPSTHLDEALADADAVVICPSNPFLSIGPVLSIPGVRERLCEGGRKVSVVTPIIAGKAVKGPADKLIQQLTGEDPSATAVARHYEGLGTHFVLDLRDSAATDDLEAMGYSVSLQDTLMTTTEDKVRLARAVCEHLGLDL